MVNYQVEIQYNDESGKPHTFKYMQSTEMIIPFRTIMSRAWIALCDDYKELEHENVTNINISKS